MGWFNKFSKYVLPPFTTGGSGHVGGNQEFQNPPAGTYEKPTIDPKDPKAYTNYMKQLREKYSASYNEFSGSFALADYWYPQRPYYADWGKDPYKHYKELKDIVDKGIDVSKYPTAATKDMDLSELERYLGAVGMLSTIEGRPDYETFFTSGMVGLAKREGQMGTTGKLFRPDTQFAPGYEGRRSKLGADVFQSGPGSGLNKPPAGGGNTGRGDRVIHSPLPAPKYDGTAPTTALGGQPVQGTQVTGGIYGGPSMPASDKPLAVAAPAKKPTRLGGY